MPQKGNKHWGQDSFESDGAAFRPGKNVHGAGDAHLGGEVLNPGDYHRPMGEQYGTVYMHPGTPTRLVHTTKNLGGIGPRVTDEQYATVNGKLA